ncbi:MAG: UDP-N-acetylmuramoyl-tripeptide--D-alanyl-D-alanine ligase [Actinomycetota bacterium]|nr:UDP-N-acetylmuramoyl-tripeptide--D-alanyl-D-alanine ligase [Actinomycetota bacterium]
MTRLTAREIAHRALGRLVGDETSLVDSWAFDSRALAPGACFVALRDARDGHDFVEAAFDAGATVALVDDDFAPPRRLDPGHALVHVGDPLGALQEVARSLRLDRPELHVVAVGGSTGKTSTKDLLAAALASEGCYANAESYNNEFGLPITLCNAPDSARVVVTEMGERFAGDLRALCEIARPDTGLVTNAGLAHAEHLGGREGVVAVLSELMEALPGTGVAVLNADDPATRALTAATLAEVVTVGESEAADYRITDVTLDGRQRPSFLLEGHRFRVPLHGRHQAWNAAMAIAVARRVFSVPLETIADSLGATTPGRWRMELLETASGVTILNDAYNANPASMWAALVTLRRFELRAGARRIAVLGDMRELGAHHDEEHRIVGERAAELGIDVVVGVGAGGAVIAEAARTGGVDTHPVADAAEAIGLVATLVQPGDAVLVKGSRALGLERVADGMLASDDTGEHSGGYPGGHAGSSGRCGGGDRP